MYNSSNGGIVTGNTINIGAGGRIENRVMDPTGAVVRSNSLVGGDANPPTDSKLEAQDAERIADILGAMKMEDFEEVLRPIWTELCERSTKPEPIIINLWSKWALSTEEKQTCLQLTGADSDKFNKVYTFVVQHNKGRELIQAWKKCEQEQLILLVKGELVASEKF